MSRHNYYGKFKPTKGAFGGKSKFQKMKERQHAACVKSSTVKQQIENLKAKQKAEEAPKAKEAPKAEEAPKADGESPKQEQQ